MLSFFKKPVVISILIIIILGAGGFLFFGREKAPQYKFVEAAKGDLTQEVNVTGRVVAAQKRDLSFEKTGKISAVYVQVGDRVKVGQLLIKLNADELTAQLAQAQAAVESARGQLMQLQAALDREHARLDGLRAEGSNAEEVNIPPIRAGDTLFQFPDMQSEWNRRTSGGGAIQAQIDAQQAQVRVAQAAIVTQNAAINQAQAVTANILAQMEKTELKSPMDGIVILQDAEVGETVPAARTIVSVIAESQFEIEANVTEIDIAKIRLNENAKVTLDAYGGEQVLHAVVSEIDPGEKIVEGVATYKITLRFAALGTGTTPVLVVPAIVAPSNTVTGAGALRIMSGMTANLDILTDSRFGAIYIPERLISYGEDGKFIKVLKGENPEEVKIEVGMRASDGNIEIISGLAEGDKVITGEG